MLSAISGSTRTTFNLDEGLRRHTLARRWLQDRRSVGGMSAGVSNAVTGRLVVISVGQNPDVSPDSAFGRIPRPVFLVALAAARLSLNRWIT